MSDTTGLIEIMVDRHISGNYQEIRNIIFGKHREHLIKITENLKDESKQSDRQIFQKKGMTFYDGEVYENVRILIDENTRRILEVLFTISKNVIEYRQIIDIIIAEWNTDNIQMSNDIINIDPDICGSLSLYGIEIKEDLWKDLKRISKNKRISVSDSFKQAVMQFLENRSQMLRERIGKD